ncbi:MAG TPA: AEC family transporter [Thermoleophilaceae bacterium]|nr:AEC family transporter [Thermoleophilaceae bacterium]
MIPLAAVIGAATAVGVVADRRRHLAADRLARRLMDGLLWVLLPIVAFVNMAALELTPQVGAGIGFAYVGLAVTLALAWALGTHVLNLSRPAVGALMVSAGLANTGYLGLPFTAALLGFDALPEAVAYDAVVSGIALVTAGFSVGAAFGTAGDRPRERIRAFLLRNPALWATAAGLVAPAALAPGWAVDASRGLVLLAVPIGFFAVGVALAGEGFVRRSMGGLRGTLDRAVAVAIALKLVVPPAIVLGLSAFLIDVPDAYLVQAAMPTAVNTLVVCHAYGLDRRIAAAAIAWTTTIVVCVGVVAALV